MTTITTYIPYEGSMVNNRNGKKVPWGYSKKFINHRDRQGFSFRKKPRPDALLWNPTDIHVSSGQTFDTVGTMVSNGFTYQTSCNDWSGSALWVPPTKMTVENINSFLVKIKSESVNLSVMMGEYKDTARMFEQSAVRLANMYRSARRGKLTSLLKQARKAADPLDNWMMYRYGISPFLSDAKAINDLLEQGANRPLIKKIRGKRNKTKIVTDVILLGNHRRTVHIGSMQRVAMVEYQASNLRLMQELGLTNPVNTAWELIPFSFVVDWFIGIGDYLSSLDALIGVKRAVGWTNEVWGSTVVHIPLSCSSNYSSYDRIVFPLSSSPPRWDPSITWRRLIDSTAMLRNLRRS